MMILRRADERGHANHGWLDTWHTFSFADFYDPRQMGFRALRVINDDTVAPGLGFGTHPHRDMEIITYVMTGALQHRDSMGHEAVMRAGDVQRISAGTGIEHSEFNHSASVPVHFLQVWILPDHNSATPNYAEKSFGNIPSGRLVLVASKTGRHDSLPINQDADVLLAKLAAGDFVSHAFRSGRHAWVHVAEGAVTLNGQPLMAGDGAAISNERAWDLTGTSAAQVLAFDLA